MLSLESNYTTVLPKRWSLQFFIRHTVYRCITSFEAKVKIRCVRKRVITYFSKCVRMCILMRLRFRKFSSTTEMIECVCVCVSAYNC